MNNYPGDFLLETTHTRTNPIRNRRPLKTTRLCWLFAMPVASPFGHFKWISIPGIHNKTKVANEYRTLRFPSKHTNTTPVVRTPSHPQAVKSATERSSAHQEQSSKPTGHRSYDIC